MFDLDKMKPSEKGIVSIGYGKIKNRIFAA